MKNATKELPCGKIVLKPELLKKVKKENKKVKIKTITRNSIIRTVSYCRSVPYIAKNVIDSCTLNKGNCSLFLPKIEKKPKKKWYQFWR